MGALGEIPNAISIDEHWVISEQGWSDVLRSQGVDEERPKEVGVGENDGIGEQGTAANFESDEPTKLLGSSSALLHTLHTAAQQWNLGDDGDAQGDSVGG